MHNILVLHLFTIRGTGVFSEFRVHIFTFVEVRIRRKEENYSIETFGRKSVKKWKLGMRGGQGCATENVTLFWIGEETAVWPIFPMKLRLRYQMVVGIWDSFSGPEFWNEWIGVKSVVVWCVWWWKYFVARIILVPASSSIHYSNTHLSLTSR